MAPVRGFAAIVLVVLAATAQENRADALRRAATEDRYQTSLPDDAGGAAGGGRPGGGSARVDGRGGRRSAAPLRSLLSLSPEVATAMLWLVGGVAVAVLVAALVRGRAGAVASPAAAVPARVQAAATPQAPPDAALDAEREAAAGDFVAALRTLLRRALLASRERTGGLPPHATARELLRRLQRQSVPTDPLAHLVAAVERCHFGGRAADRAQYEAGRAQLAAWEARWRPQA